MEIYNSLFIDNHSQYSSNCLTFLGLSLNVTNCTFMNNTSIVAKEVINLFQSNSMAVSDVAQLNPELGASIYFQGLNLDVRISCFIGNTGFKGGAIYLTNYIQDFLQKIFISHCYFKGNRGNVGAAINFSINLKIIDALIFFCYFHSNIGKSFYK